MNDNVQDLSTILGKPVIGNNPKPLFSIDPDEVIEDTAVLDDDPNPVQEDEYVNDSETSEQDYMPPQAIAETIVNLLDGLQSSVIPFLREKKIFTEKELEILQGIVPLSNNMTETESKVWAKWQKHLKIIEKIPFDNGEKSRLIAATVRYAETTQMKVSPLTGLMMAYSEVALKRSAYFFNE